MDGLSLKICPDAAVWDDFVQSSPQGSVFVFNSFIRAQGFKPRFYFVSAGASTVAGFPLLFEEGHEDPVKAPSLYSMYQGILFSPEISHLPSHSRTGKQHDIVAFILGELTRERTRTSFCLHYNFEDLRPIQWHCYHGSPAEKFGIDLRYTGLVDFNDYPTFDDYLHGIRKCRVQEYKKALKEGYEIIAGTADDIPVFLDLYTKTFDKSDVATPPAHLEMIGRLVRAALEEKWGEFLLCRHPQGSFIGGTLFLYDSKSSYYLFGANDPQYRKSGANTLLLVENLRRTHEKKRRYADFVGINSPRRGDFKISFNATVTPYFLIHQEKSGAP